MSTKVWPTAVFKLIEALDWRAEKLDQATSAKAIAEKPDELPQLLTMEAPGVDGWNSQEMFSGYSSAIDFFANSMPDKPDIPSGVMVMVTLGDSPRPHFVVFRTYEHAMDVQATAATLLAYYEGKEKLPIGFTEQVTSWLMGKTNRIGYSSDDMERYYDEKGIEAVTLFREAILQVSDVSEVPLLMQIFREDNFAYSSRRTYVIGRATRLFCRTFGNAEDQHYNQVLADMFEWKARDIMTWSFVDNVACKYGYNPVERTYRDLPKSWFAGAFAHLPTMSQLPVPGPDALDA